jgi:hypothetical protein
VLKSFEKFLTQTIDTVGLSIQHWYTSVSKGWSADIRVGPAQMKRWSMEGKSNYETVPWKQGLSVCSTVRTHRLFTQRVTIMMSCLIESSRLRLRRDVAAFGLLETSSPAYMAYEKGDWLTLRKLLQDKHVSINNTTGYGDTLLHVRSKLLKL